MREIGRDRRVDQDFKELLDCICIDGDGNTDAIWKEASTGNVIWLMFPGGGQIKSDAALSSTLGYSGSPKATSTATAPWTCTTSPARPSAG